VHYSGEGLGSGDALEFIRIEGIEADIDAAKASSDEPVAALGQQVAVVVMERSSTPRAWRRAM